MFVTVLLKKQDVKCYIVKLFYYKNKSNGSYKQCQFVRSLLSNIFISVTILLKKILLLSQVKKLDVFSRTLSDQKSIIHVDRKFLIGSVALLDQLVRVNGASQNNFYNTDQFWRYFPSALQLLLMCLGQYCIVCQIL